MGRGRGFEVVSKCCRGGVEVVSRWCRGGVEVVSSIKWGAGEGGRGRGGVGVTTDDRRRVRLGLRRVFFPPPIPHHMPLPHSRSQLPNPAVIQRRGWLVYIYI